MGNLFPFVDINLLKKYDKPGPRYTSYPTAPVFSSLFTAADYRQELQTPNHDSAISLYFHFPFCDTLCYFCGCTMLVTRDRKRIQEYIDYLKKEIDMVAPLLSQQRKVVQLHWGGGTPTHLSPEQILEIGQYIRKRFNFDPDAEMSVEIDPRELERGHLEALKEIGFNRVSMGVQDFDPKVQEAVNRVQPEEVTTQVFQWARDLNFHSINLDLIYGLPFQTLAGFHTTLEKTVALNPDRFAVFNYAHVPWLKPHQRLIGQDDLPKPGEKLEILKMTIEYLSAQGYLYIGMDHFAKPSDELAIAQRERTLYRNFQGYSTRADADLYGFGMSSISHSGRVYAQNAKQLTEYYAALSDGTLPTMVGYRMTEDDHLRKHVIMRLMCDLELNKRAVEQRFGIEFDTYFALSNKLLEPLEEDGLLALHKDTITIHAPGRLLLRNIAMCFDAYLESMMSQKPVFSRTV